MERAEFLSWAASLPFLGWVVGRTPAPALPEGVTEVKVARVRPGDTVVFRCKGPVTADAVANIREAARAAFPDAGEVLILDGGLDVEIVRRAPRTEEEG